jgi:hypothetical protein
MVPEGVTKPVVSIARSGALTAAATATLAGRPAQRRAATTASAPTDPAQTHDTP